MTALDSDVFSLLLAGSRGVAERFDLVAITERALPIPVVEEALRGRLNGIRQAESGKGKIALSMAYEKFEQSLAAIRNFRLLPFTPEAESRVREWREQKLKVGTLDLRIAATCIVAGAKLATGNRCDFDRVPSLRVEYWNEPTTPKGESK